MMLILFGKNGNTNWVIDQIKQENTSNLNNNQKNSVAKEFISCVWNFDFSLYNEDENK